jgi:hypothetical protein
MMCHDECALSPQVTLINCTFPRISTQEIAVGLSPYFDQWNIVPSSVLLLHLPLSLLNPARTRQIFHACVHGITQHCTPDRDIHPIVVVFVAVFDCFGIRDHLAHVMAYFVHFIESNHMPRLALVPYLWSPNTNVYAAKILWQSHLIVDDMSQSDD